jgi:NADH:ubiquinone oxidoreductase subunit E
MSAHAANPALVQPQDLTLDTVRARLARQQPRVDELLRRYPVKRGALLQALWLVQEEFGWVPRVGIQWAAEVCAVSPVHAFGVVEFYTMYRQVPMGRYLIQVCQTMCCHLQGSEELIAHLEKSLGIHAGQTTPDGLFSLLRVECLALCGTGPGVMINDQAIGPEPRPLDAGRLVEGHLDNEGFHPTPAVLDRWVDFLKAEAARHPQPRPDAVGDVVLNTRGHPGAAGANADPLPADYAPPAPALKLAAKTEGGTITVTWINDPGCAKVVVERSDDGGTAWREVASVGPRDQKLVDQLAIGATAFYRVIAHEKTRAARPTPTVSVTAVAAPAAAPAPAKA